VRLAAPEYYVGDLFRRELGRFAQNIFYAMRRKLVRARQVE
jgi:hypothetical protein